MDRVAEVLAVHPRGDFENAFLRVQYDGQKDRPETTDGTVNADSWSTSTPVSSARPPSSGSSAPPGRADRRERHASHHRPGP
jgi:hypothetical protein